MSKSLDFCITRASNASCSSYSDRDWGKAVENTETETIFDEYLNGKRKFRINGVDDSGNAAYVDVEIQFDSDADFDYFTSDSCVHDGTLLFVVQTIKNCVDKICYAQTYNKNSGEPKSGDTIKYEVGNFVVLNEFGKQFALEDKPWLQERTTVLLPLKVEIN